MSKVIYNPIYTALQPSSLKCRHFFEQPIALFIFEMEVL